MKRILGLDLGTNSIGWALVAQNFEEKQGEILGMGSRIIPMSQDILGEFGKEIQFPKRLKEQVSEEPEDSARDIYSVGKGYIVF
ncbi:hypothetical protein QWY93_00095 [Echinicola jeungdonensis]|uniref:hypothetical protein n=1 Tax=Echinicola jeungdonensis TaxID=709343 RepID=UPI0025B43AE0|nr:hypothetical protein [Echinicola jeungdonensis]MDN3667743.1 hypothetical protein [Echinicola jeungdonensis]